MALAVEAEMRGERLVLADRVDRVVTRIALSSPREVRRG
jgi:hypothetical protein